MSQTLQASAALYRHVRSSVDTQRLRQELHRPFRFLLSGNPALVAQLRSSLLAPFLEVQPSTEAPRLLETIHLHECGDPIRDETRCVLHVGELSETTASLLRTLRLPIFAIDIDDEPLAATPAHALAKNAPPNPGSIEAIRLTSWNPEILQLRLFPRLMSCCRGREVAVGRHLPILREAAASALTRGAARNALQVAAASAIVGQVPILGILLGAVTTASDIVAMSVIQLHLALQIGALFDREPDLATTWHLLPIVGGGLGWRALARELTGFVPIAGPVLKAAIAYAGTILVGEAATMYYRSGGRIDLRQAVALSRETKRAAFDLARDAVDRIRRRRCEGENEGITP